MWAFLNLKLFRAFLFFRHQTCEIFWTFSNQLTVWLQSQIFYFRLFCVPYSHSVRPDMHNSVSAAYSWHVKSKNLYVIQNFWYTQVAPSRIFILAVLLHYIFNLLVLINFVQIARKWKEYTEKWSQITKNLKLLSIVDMKAKESDNRMLRWFGAFVLSSNLSYFLVTSKSSNAFLNCKQDTDTISKSWTEYTFRQFFPEFFKIFPYHFCFGCFFVFIDYSLSFYHVFNECFIILLSQLITRRFELLNEKLSMNVCVSEKLLWKMKSFWLKF